MEHARMTAREAPSIPPQRRQHYVLAAGGTGGHMIPAHALAAELGRRGHFVTLITDTRGAAIPGLFDGVDTHILPAGRLGGGPLGIVRALRGIVAGRKRAKALYHQRRPTLVIGFGGYPALPALLAALSADIPTAIHEQNAVLGRVNRLLARRVKLIATAYPDVERLPASARDKVRMVGNPVREEILELRDQPFPLLTGDGVFRLLVTGGSQGATILSEVVPDGLAMLPAHFKSRLQVTQQCRPEDIDEVRRKYARIGIPADCATYLPDLPDRLGWTHLFIGRAGASTIAELTAAGRPAILIPLPSAMDDHQTANARSMAKGGGARMIRQSRFTPTELAKQMQKMALEPGALENAARRAKAAGLPDATADLADSVEALGGAPRAATSTASASKQRVFA
jgi:UDP-N-acetylglucosamine--N-acetylmuramyl-(pentapeptide) pyrophosphoryl-undecaprenol N-acetylglucosamine transferase